MKSIGKETTPGELEMFSMEGSFSINIAGMKYTLDYRSMNV